MRDPPLNGGHRRRMIRDGSQPAKRELVLCIHDDERVHRYLRKVYEYD